MAINPWQNALEAMRRRAWERQWEKAIIEAQCERRKAIGAQDEEAFAHWHHEVQVLTAMGPAGFATLRGEVRPDFLGQVAEAVSVAILYDQDAIDPEDDQDECIQITVDEDGTPWVWAPPGWADEKVLEMLRRAVAAYDDTSEDHL